MFSYNVFELIASFGSIRDYVHMMRIAISDAPSNLVERRCATYKWESQIEAYSEYSDPWCEYISEPDPDDVEADDRISSGIDDLENDYKASMILAIDFKVNQNFKITMQYSSFHDSDPPMLAEKTDESISTMFSYNLN